LSSSAGGSRLKKVIVVGLDGVDPHIVNSLLSRQQLPSLARLAASGRFTTVATTYPAQTPVAWSTFATGTNPGGHGIYDFLRRDPETYLPDIALNRYEQRASFLPPKVVNQRRGTPIWEVLAEAGVPATVLRCPCTYPPDRLRGKLLSGMGVPDVRGGFGTGTFYTTASQFSAGESETIIPITMGSDGKIRTHVVGPRNPKLQEDATHPITVEIDSTGRNVRIHSNGQPEHLDVGEGEWSGWLRIKFRLGRLQTVRGMVRFHLARAQPDLELYASPVNFDPSAPMFPISSPQEYADELARKLGVFYTTGMVEDHTGLDNGRFGEDVYLDQCSQVMDEREAMMVYELERFDEGLFFCLFDTPDRIQHMFWRFREPEHPAAGKSSNRDLQFAIEEHYKRCDELVGKAMEYVDDDTLFVVLSDHGFCSFQRAVHINTWLLQSGHLALRAGMSVGEEAGDLLKAIDWDSTNAYALGLGGIYLNLKGREANGIVEPSEAHELKDRVRRELTGLEDTERGAVAVRSVVSRESVYSGPYVGESPDLVVNFSPGYRASWQTSLGAVPATLIEDNCRKWSGDHVVDPTLVPGVLLMNKPWTNDGARLLDIAPTILNVLGVPKGAEMEGESLLP
jgi:predicted AlkP superfamily phosphohydrolase/phosphomutase